jgi:hypothetical protein
LRPARRARNTLSPGSSIPIIWPGI